MSLFNFHNTFAGDTLREKIIFKWWQGGEFSIIAGPCNLWYNGSSYVVGYSSNEFNNIVYIVKQTGIDLEATQVNNGTSTPEPLNHPAPAIFIDNAGYIYVIQNNLHVSYYKIWKSTNPEDISSFDYVGQFANNEAYIQLVKQDDDDLILLTRSGDGGFDIFDQTLITVNLNNPDSWSQLKISNTNYASTQTRHYPINLYRYGTSTYYVGGINHRYDTLQTYYKLSVWVTEDFINYSNIDLSFTKDIPTNGELTVTELEDNFAMYGTDSDKSIGGTVTSLIQINNTIYYTYGFLDGTINIVKHIIGESTSESFAFTAQGNNAHLVYNGTNIVIVYLKNGQTQTASIRLDLTAFEEEYVIKTSVDAYMSIPQNFHEVDGEYLMIGKAETDDDGRVKYKTSTDKFINE